MSPKALPPYPKEQSAPNKKTTKPVDPLQLQAYFDGELDGDELDAMSLAELQADPRLSGFQELRELVRYDQQCLLDDIDDIALFNDIRRQIASESKLQASSPKTAARYAQWRQSLKRQRAWLPSLVALALFLLSLPGLHQRFFEKTHSSPDLSAQDANAPLTPLCDAPVLWQKTPTVTPQPPLEYQRSYEQLTIQEMDLAIRHLIRRIEALEGHDEDNAFDKPETAQKQYFDSPNAL